MGLRLPVIDAKANELVRSVPSKTQKNGIDFDKWQKSKLLSKQWPVNGRVCGALVTQ